MGNWVSRYKYPLIGGGLLAGMLGVLAIRGIVGPTSVTPTGTLLLKFDSRTPEYLKQHAQSWMTKPAAATNYLHCPMSDLSSYSNGLNCIDQSSSWTLLTQRTTTSQYQLHTPIPAKGQGRKGWFFNGTSSSAGSYVRAPSASTVSFGTVTALAIEVLAAPMASTGTSQILATTQDAGSTTSKGVSLFTGGPDTNITCQINGNGSSVQFGYADFVPDSKVHHFLCVKTWSGSAWTTAIYIDGKSKTVAESGSSNGNDISSGVELTVGANNGSTLYPFRGYIYEVKLSNTSRDSSYAAASYRQSIYNGTYWSTDANTIFLAKFDEKDLSSGLLDYSGGSKNLTTVGGTPAVRLGYLPYPMGDGFSRKAIFMSNDETNYNYFADSGTSYGDVTTNDFSMSFWISPRSNPAGASGSEDRIVSKVTGPGVGWDIYRETTNGDLNILIGDSGGISYGTVVAIAKIPNNLWSFVTVNFDRSGNAYAYVDGASVGTNVDISTRSGTLTNSQYLTIGNYSASPVAGYNYDGNMAEFMFSDGLTTLAEHQAMYKAFRAPANVSYEPYLAQTTHRKYDLPLETGTYGHFGQRLGVYKGDSSVPQWPVSYNARLVSTRTNVAGYVNQFNLWSTSGSPTVTADTAVGPRGGGTATADRIAFTTSGDTVYKDVVGGGTSNETTRYSPYTVSVYFRRISGSCTDVQLSFDTGYSYGSKLWNSDSWVRASFTRMGSSYKRISLRATTSTACTIEVAEAQYEEGWFATDLCTGVTGDVSQTCDDGSNTLGLGFPAWQQTVNTIGYTNQFDQWTVNSVTVATDVLEAPDGSITADSVTFNATGDYISKDAVGGGTVAAGERWCASIRWKYYGICTTNSIVLCPDIECSTSVLMQDGAYGEWNLAKVCGNTAGNTKGIKINDSYGGTACTYYFADAQYEQDNFTSSCTSVEGDVSQTCNVNYMGMAGNLASMPYSMERGEIITSAVLEPMAHAPNVTRRLWRLGDGGEYLNEGIQPVFEIRDLGGYLDGVVKGKPIGSDVEKRTYVTSWDYRDGIPNTDVDRYSWKFERASSQHVEASSTSVANPSSATALSVELLLKHNIGTDYEVPIDTSGVGTGAGYYVATSSTGLITCGLYSTAFRYCTSGIIIPVSSVPHYIACVWDKNGSNWNDPKLYVDSNLISTTCTGSTPSGSLSNSQPLSVGGQTSYYSDTNIYEARVLTKALTADEVNKDWKASRGLGQVWAKDSAELVHYNFMESATTSGLLDISGNANHLTVVSASSPTARSTELPWPDGGNKRYASMTINGSYAKSTLQPRALSATVPSTPWNRRHPNSPYAIFGCATTSTQCLNGVIENFEWWSRPSPKNGVPDDITHLLTADFSGSSYLNYQSIPVFPTPSGATATNVWTWNANEFSGNLIDVVNGKELSPTGTIRYSAWTGMLARGQGRRGMYFNDDNGDVDRLKAASTSIASLDGVTGFTLEATVHNTQPTDNGCVLHSRGVGGGSGIAWCWSNSEDKLQFAVGDGTNYRNYTANAAMGSDYGPHHYVVVGTYAASDWTFVMYKDGSTIASTLGGSATTNAIANAQPLAVGAISDYTADYGFTGTIYEIMISNTARTATEIKNHYKQSIQQGTFWTDDTNTIAHYYLNDIVTTNGIGLTDYSGHDNHLTVKTGTPKGYDQHLNYAPWPMGSGLAKTGLEHAGGSGQYFSSTDSSFLAADSNPYSIVTWIRESPIYTRQHYPWLVHNGGSAPRYGTYTNSGAASCFAQLSGGTSTSSTSTFNDNNWHLFACKIQYTGGSGYRACTSLDGSAFSCGSYVTGTISGASASITAFYDGSENVGNAGLQVLKNYELTDSEVVALAAYNGSDPTGGLLTYSRTNKACYNVGNNYTVVSDAADYAAMSGMQVRCFGAGQVPYAWDASMSTGGTSMPGNRNLDLGEPVHTAIENKSYYSERLDQWAYNMMVTRTANSTIAPDGTKTADTMAADGSTNWHYTWNTDAGVNVATDSYVIASTYLKKGTYQYQEFAVETYGVFSYAWVIVDLDNVEITDASTYGGDWSTPTSYEIYGVANGWVNVRFAVKCNNRSGCTAVSPIFCLTTNSTGHCNSHGGSDYTYIWGTQMAVSTTPRLDRVYCPTPTNATVTCNAVASNYIAAANMTGWSRAQGVVVAHGIAGQQAEFQLYNGSSAVGQHNFWPTYNGNLTIYDSSGTLAQQVYGATSTYDVLRSQTSVWDSTLDFDGTRQAYSFINAASYAGKSATWANDVGNWTPAGNTNLVLGNPTSYELQGIAGGVSVYTKR